MLREVFSCAYGVFADEVCTCISGHGHTHTVFMLRLNCTNVSAMTLVLHMLDEERIIRK